MAKNTQQETTSRLKEVALLFLRLGATAWGGPAVSIAMMYDEAVRRRRWLDDERFLDIMGVTNLIPGPNATEIATHLGLIRAGWKGFFAGGILFLLPGLSMTFILAWLYVAYGSLPEVEAILYGIKPAVIAVVIHALVMLGKSAFVNWHFLALGVVCFALYLLGVEELLLLFGGAAFVLIWKGGRQLFKRGITGIICLPALVNLALLQNTLFLKSAVSFSNMTLFLRSLKIGSVMFGTGYVLIALAESEFVSSLGWITNSQLIDSITVGQALPGPLSKSIAFIGYIVGGMPSALLATAGFFIPSFVLVAFLSRLLILVRKSWWAGAFVDGVKVASLGLMAGATVNIARNGVVDIFTALLALAALIFIFRYKINAHWIILGGGVMGMIYKLLVT